MKLIEGMISMKNTYHTLIYLQFRHLLIFHKHV